MEFVPAQVIGSYKDWGELVLSWATGVKTPPGDPFNDDSVRRVVFADGAPRQIGAAGAGVILPPSVKEVVFVQDTETRFYIRIPGKVMVQQAQRDIGAGSDYLLPQFYTDAPLNCATPQNAEQKLRLQAERVGDYSIGVCM